MSTTKPKRPKRDEDGDDDAGPKDLAPLRTCIVTRETGSPDAMVRFVLSPEGHVTPDIRRRLPGRGVWVNASRKTVSEAARRRAFDRGFRQPSAVPGDLADQVDALLESDALAMLSLANKAGVVVAGFGKVETAIVSGAAGIVIHAADAAADGVRKLDGAEYRVGRAPAHVNLFDAARLGLALGRPHVIHAALKSGAAGEAFLARCRRLQAFRAGGTDDKIGQGPGSGTNE